MTRMETPNRHSYWRTHLGRTPEGGSVVEVDAWIPSKINAISPLVERLMRFIETSHCITGDQHALQLALREAVNNAVVHATSWMLANQFTPAAVAKAGTESR